MEMEPAAKNVRRRRDFKAGSALNTSEHFWVPWEDFEDCLDILVNQKKWLLISGPFQSGKSSLAFALADEAAKDWISLVTTLTTDMVDVANDSTLSEMEASDRFFALLAEAIVTDSGGVLEKAPLSSETPRAGMMQVLRLLQKGFSGEPDVIWFIDEAALLNEITRPNIIRSFLSGLRTCKERSRRDRGVYRLRSFALVGTAKTRMLLTNAREERILEADLASNRHDSYNPFPPGVPISPLSMERNRELDLLRQEDILSMLRRYGLEHCITFLIGEDGGNDQNTQALEKIAADIYERTNGYKGMVGSCCEYLQIHGIRSWTRWKREVRDGYVTKYVLNFKVYSKILSNVPRYAERLRSLILECVNSGCGVPFQDRDMNWVLPAVNDGVLAVGPSGNSINVTSALLLGAILEDSRLACSEPAERVDTFEDAVRSSFRYMKPRRLLMDEVLNRNGQPSEYIWQSEFLLALKFVLDSGYNGCRYVVLVECKKRNKRGQRRDRVDFYLRNAGSPNKAFEVQGKGDAQSIKAHIARSEKYRRLYAGCEMNYVYFTVGEDEAKATIQSESVRFGNIKCWFVQYLPEDNEWNIEQLHVGSGWHSVRLGTPSHYPRFMFGTRQF